MKELPSTKVLYKQAIEWALKITGGGGWGFQLSTPGATPRNVQTVEQVSQSINVEIRRDCPHRLRAIESVCNDPRAHETDDIP